MPQRISMGHREVVVIPGTSDDFDITKVQNWRLPLKSVSGTFTVGEGVWQETTGAIGIVYSWSTKSKALRLVEMSGTFNATNIIHGSLSGATGIPLEVGYAFPRGIRLSAIDWRSSAIGDILQVRHVQEHGQIIYSRKETTGQAGGLHQAVGGRSLRVKPYIVRSECYFTQPENVKIRFEYD